VNTNFSDSAQIFKLINRIGQLIDRNLLTGQSVSEAFSEGQIRSKAWIVEKCLEHHLDLKTVFLCGGWYATLFLDDRLKYGKVRSFDIDPICEFIADEIHRDLVSKDWKFKAVTADIHTISFDQHTYKVRRKDGTFCQLTDSPDTVINTSCEHIENFSQWYQKLPKNKLIILQSNNGFNIPGHVNCSQSLDLFAQATPFAKTVFSGELLMPQFTRYMRIGYL
jgi:hypothetical protein